MWLSNKVSILIFKIINIIINNAHMVDENYSGGQKWADSFFFFFFLWKGSLLVALDYGFQHFFYFYIDES